MTQEQIEAIGDCGGAEMPIEETCLIAGCTEEEFWNCQEAMNAYKREQLKTKLRIRQSVIKMAKEGVPQMVKIYLDRYELETLNDGEDEDIETGE